MKNLKPIHDGNLQCFLEVYKKHLIECRAEFPSEYAWPDSELDAVFERMSRAIVKGSFSKDSHAFKRTCKELKIKHTYQAIRDFISL